jgi:GNAT superfamily N-acetyltransferase
MREQGWRMSGSPTSGTTTSSTDDESAIREATANDESSLTKALAEAFVEDPIFSWLMPDQASRLARLRRFFSIELHHLVLKRGQAWTSNELSGTALSLPPGVWSTPPRVALLQAGCFGMGLHRAAGLLTLIEWRHLREPHYYFAYIGVAPAAQGQGLGSRLMRPALDRCDELGVPAYLEASSERNAALYERLGFKLKREVRFGSSPPLRLMVRAPHPQ